MNAHAEIFHHRPSRQIRPGNPSPGDTPHERAAEMAEAMREGATTPDALIAEGFTLAEIAEFKDEAVAIARSRSIRQVAIRGDLLADMKLKVREANATFMPLARGIAETQAVSVAWGRYCLARAAYALDPWECQRLRCLEELDLFLLQIAPKYPAIRTELRADAQATVLRKAAA